MINFLKRLRFDQINQEKNSKSPVPVSGSVSRTGRYLKYAFGEIILVVIGILIALQINAWYQGRLDKTNELLLVEQMLFDAQADSLFFQDRIYKLKVQLSFYEDILNLCNEKSLSKEYNSPIERKDQPFIKLANQSSLINNNPDAYSNLINKELKMDLQKHIAKYEFVFRSLDFYNLQMDEYVTPLRVKYYPVMPDQGQASSIEEFSFLCENNETQGIIQLLTRNSKNSIRHIQEFLTSNTRLSSKFRDYLKNGQK